MNKGYLIFFVLILGVGLGFWAGYKGGLQHQNTSAVEEKKPLYYRHPMNPKVTSLIPTKDEVGMDYVPVYAELTSSPPASQEAGKILYYRHPMGAADTSLVPKKDEMGMDYLPVYEKELVKAGQLEISPEKIQKLGVTTEIITSRKLTRSIRALGSIQVDERRIHAVTARFEGWVQRLYINTTGATVKRGEALLEVYSPELITAQQEYLIALQGQQALKQGSAQARGTAEQLTDNALQRLHYWDIAPAQLQRLKSQENMLDALPLLSPVNGVVLDKPAQEGMRFMPGELLFRIADLSRVWLVLEVFEQDIDKVRLGQVAQVHINAYPDRQFIGKVQFIYPTLTAETRTVKVRVELANNEDLLKPGLYGGALLVALEDKPGRLAVPDSAVLDSGTRQVVLVQKAEGRFVPHAVKLGGQADDYWEVLEGLEAGDKVVTRANFLIDAESNLKSVLNGFDSQGAETRQAKPEVQQQGDH